MDDQIKHLINENVKLKKSLKDLLVFCGKRGVYNTQFYTCEYQPEPIKRAMILLGIDKITEEE